MTDNKPRVPLCRPEFGPEEFEGVREVLASGWLAHGPKVKQFEQQFAAYIGVAHAVSLNSCASALQAAIMAYGLRGEIILPSFTFPASANAIMLAGCTPVFADIHASTGNIDPSDLESRITPRTVGIMPVHFAGQGCEMDRVMAIAEKHKLQVIEDSAEAIGSTYQGRKTGSFGVGCFSFYPTKNMTTAEGGMVTTDDTRVAEAVKTLRGHGISTGAHDRTTSARPWLREAVQVGYNFRMNEIAAVLGLAQLRKLDDLNAKRRAHATYLSQQIAEVPGIQLPHSHPDAIHTFQMYTIQLADGIPRDDVVTYLREHGVEASVHFCPPLHLQKFYQETLGCKEGSLPVTERVSRSIVTLPMFPSLTREQLDTVVTTVRDAVRRYTCP